MSTIQNTSPLLARLRATAEQQNAVYPQYRGYWDGPEWTIVRFKRQYRTKLGLAFERGDYAIGKFNAEGWWTVYSSRNQCNTRVAGNVIVTD